jgi:hypothetical protein
MLLIDRSHVDYATRQAAVWVITDDASYDELGILVRPSSFGFGGTRVIGLTEAGRALQICDEAGIDITQRALWRDRARLLDGLADGELKRWLSGRPS